MTPVEARAFGERWNPVLKRLKQIQALRDEASALSGEPLATLGRLEAMAAEAIGVARDHDDDTSLREIEVVLRRVLDRHALPKATEWGVAQPAGVLRYREAVALLEYVLRDASDFAKLAEGHRALTLAAVDERQITMQATHVLRTYAEHFPGGSSDASIRDAIVDAALRGRSIVVAVLRAWTATADPVTARRRIKAAQAVERRQK